MFDHALHVQSKVEITQAIASVIQYLPIHLSVEQQQQLQQYFQACKKTACKTTDSTLLLGHLVNDTRMLNAGDVFCAVIGHQVDGRDYIEQAIDKNCLLVLAETTDAKQDGKLTWQANHKQKQPELNKNAELNKNVELNINTEQAQASSNVTAILYVYQLNQRLFRVASAFYGQPKQHLTIIGITGTNGKTSTSQVIAQLLDSCAKNCAVIGTNGAGKVSQLMALKNTTPAATQLQQLLASFVQDNITDVAMEVSSHALAQQRVSATLFDIAVFTNLTRDHLDYHQTMAAYAKAKYQIFTGDKKQVAIVNGDDAQAQQWLAQWPESQKVIVYGRTPAIKKYACFIQASDIKHHQNGVTFNLVTANLTTANLTSGQGQYQINSPLLADFNVDNLLAAIAVLVSKNIDIEVIIRAIKTLSAIKGRMETFSAPNQATTVVDYAHTPDALKNALQACRLHCHGQLWLVFGCGGDRDQGKRPLMAEVAEQFADHIIVSNDNPRNEAPEAIVADIIKGFTGTDKVKQILDRKQAITYAMQQANANDMVLCAGKGHEDYIEINNESFAYDERALVQRFYQTQQQSAEVSV